MIRSYEEFRKSVKDDLRESLSAWKLSEPDLEEYVANSEDEIKCAYDGYVHPGEDDHREDDARFKSDASTIAYSLQLSY